MSRRLRLNYGVYEYYGANFELLKEVASSTKVSQNPQIKTKLFQVDNAIKGHNLSLIISLTKPKQFSYLWDKLFTNPEQSDLLEKSIRATLKETTKENTKASGTTTSTCQMQTVDKVSTKPSQGAVSLL